MIGALRVDVLETRNGGPAWRGMATGVRTEDRRRNEKTVIEIIKKMFKTFPHAAK